MKITLTFLIIASLSITTSPLLRGAEDGRARPGQAMDDLLAGHFNWTASAPLVAPVPEVDHGLAIKDPSVVYFGNRRHIYATLRNERSAYMEYLNFADWKDANAAPRTVISLIEKYHCAPQIFFFTPKKKWYLIYQTAALTPRGFFGPAYSTLDDVSKPKSLTPPVMLFGQMPANVKHWIDFWVGWAYSPTVPLTGKRSVPGGPLIWPPRIVPTSQPTTR